jgi:hypothetical protein
MCVTQANASVQRTEIDNKRSLQVFRPLRRDDPARHRRGLGFEAPPDGQRTSHRDQSSLYFELLGRGRARAESKHCRGEDRPHNHHRQPLRERVCLTERS